VDFLRLPEAVTACLIALGPVLRRAEEAFSALVILAATALGRQEGYGRLDSPFFADLRPQGLPVFTSTHSSLNHFLRAAPFLLFLTATFVTPILSAYFAAFGYSTRGVCRRPDFVSRLDLLCTSVVSFFGFGFRHLFTSTASCASTSFYRHSLFFLFRWSSYFASVCSGSFRHV